LFLYVVLPKSCQEKNSCKKNVYCVLEKNSLIKFITNMYPELIKFFRVYVLLYG